MSLANVSISLEEYRQQFPALTNKAYFNFGGQGAMPQQAIAAILKGHEFSQSQGPFSNEVNQWATEERELTRRAIATELRVAPSTITLTEDVTVGCNIPLWGIEWHEGDHILLTDCEHPGIIAAVKEVQRRFGLEVSTCPILSTLNGGDPAAMIAQHLRPTTRLVVVSHILWNTGQVLPLKEISRVCHNFPHQRTNSAAPVQVLVDAAQSVGVLPMDLSDTEADFYAFTGHKWLCGPAGIGGLYVHPNAFETIHPTFIGWRGMAKSDKTQLVNWHPDGRRFEVATSDFTLYGALREAIALQNAWGTDKQRYQRICHLSAYLWQRLNEIPAIACLKATPPEAGLVSFQISGVHHGLFVQTLEQQGFLLRTLAEPDCIRACVHYLTLESEIDRLIDAIQAALSKN